MQDAHEGPRRRRGFCGKPTRRWGSQDRALQEHVMRWNEAHKEDDLGQKHLPVSSE